MKVARLLRDNGFKDIHASYFGTKWQSIIDGIIEGIMQWVGWHRA
jgi:hypothetical protein